MPTPTKQLVFESESIASLTANPFEYYIEDSICAFQRLELTDGTKGQSR